MPIDLLGKVHKTIFIEGVSLYDHEVLAEYVKNICGPLEAYDSVEGRDGVPRLWVIFANQLSVETASARLDGTAFQYSDTIIKVRRADEKTAAGKSILGSAYSTAAVPAAAAPKAEGSGRGGVGSGPRIAGLLGAAKGIGSFGNSSAVRDAAAKKAENNAMMMALMASGGNSMQLLLGGPQGWKVGDKNDNAPTLNGSQKKSQQSFDDDEKKALELLAEAEAEAAASVANNATIKTSTGNLIQTEAELAAEKAAVINAVRVSGGGVSLIPPSHAHMLVSPSGAVALGATTLSSKQQLFALGNKTIPTNMRLPDIEVFLNEHLRRQVDALLTLGEHHEKELLEEITRLEQQLEDESNDEGNKHQNANDTHSEDTVNPPVLSNTDEGISDKCSADCVAVDDETADQSINVACAKIISKIKSSSEPEILDNATFCTTRDNE